MKTLKQQIIRFGIVGILSFIIDFGIYTLLCNYMNVHYLIAGICGFTLSIIFNYIVSMRYIFVRRDDLSRSHEFIIYITLSIIGCGLNSAILFLCIDGLYWHWNWLQQLISIQLANIGAKAFATGIVMIYNFITRKIFLEQKS